MKLIRKLIEGTIEAFYELKHSRKKDTSLKCLIKVMGNNRIVDTYDGLLTLDRRAIWIHDMQTFVPAPVLYNDAGRNVVYLPEGYHTSLKPEMIRNISKAQKIDFTAKIKYMKQWRTVEIEKCDGTVDFNILDNEVSIDFSRVSYQVMQSTALKFLQEIQNIKFILSLIVAFLFGALFGSTGMSIINLIYRMVQ